MTPNTSAPNTSAKPEVAFSPKCDILMLLMAVNVKMNTVDPMPKQMVS